MDCSEIPPEILSQWYRLAVLLTGRRSSAEAVLLATFGELTSMFDQVRSEKSQHETFVRRLRQRCLEFHPAESPDPELDTPALARAVAAIPEPARSAMALFYLKLLAPSDIAALLDTSLEELADLLANGRTLLPAFAAPPVA